MDKSGYLQGWAAGVSAMTDLLLAEGLDAVAANNMCMDAFQRMLHEWDGSGDPPEMERERLTRVPVDELDDEQLAAVGVIPFSEPPLPLECERWQA